MSLLGCSCLHMLICCLNCVHCSFHAHVAAYVIRAAVTILFLWILAELMVCSMLTVVDGAVQQHAHAALKDQHTSAAVFLCPG
jgi:hypothetical protein